MGTHEQLHRFAVRLALRRFHRHAPHFQWMGAPKRLRRRDKDLGGVPVEPDRPNTLSGGAAAPLEFDS